MRNYQWNEHLISVELRPLEAFLWLAYGIEVRVDQRKFLPKPDRIGLTTYTDFEIKSQDGSRTTGVVKTLAPIWLLPRVKCSIIVSDTVIAREVLPLRRWYLSYLAWFIVMLVLLFAVLGLVFVLLIIGTILSK
jgi:hypothetical protein